MTNINLLDDTAKTGISQQISQEFTRAIFTKFPELVDVRVMITKLTFVIQSPKWRCYGNKLIFGAFCRRRNWPSPFFALAFHNELQYRHVNTCINSDASTSCKNLVNFGPVTPVIMRVEVKILPRLGHNLPTHFYHRPRIRGDNTFSSVRVCVSVRLNRLTFDFDFCHEDRIWPWLACDCRSRS